MTTAIYPGTFDPVTLGHKDVIERAATIFNRLLVAVGDNPAKDCAFTIQQRIAMMREEVGRLKNVEILRFEGLMVDFARVHEITTVLRGIRTVSDLEYEIQMAFTNRSSGGVETLFIAPRPEFAYINARFIKEIAARGGDVDGMVSPHVKECLRRRYAAHAPSASKRRRRSRS